MNNFFVVLNGCQSVIKPQTIDVRNQYKIKKSEFLFAFIGNVGDRKNQKQVVDAFSILPDLYKNKIRVVFVGGGEYNALTEYIETKNLSDKLIVCGPVPQEEIHNYYFAADATILTSLSEGFGLSIIEGMRYGCPNLVFSDLPAVPDLYHECAMLTVNKRTNEELSKKMIEMVEHNWNHEDIVKFSERFSLKEMANNYIELYKKL